MNHYLKVLSMVSALFNRRKAGKSEERKECSHDFEREVYRRYVCDVCGKVLARDIKLRCRKCGYTTFETETVERYEKIHYMSIYKEGYGADNLYLWLCLDHYKRFREKVEEVARVFEILMPTLNFTVYDYELIVINSVHDIDRFITEMGEYITHISKPKVEFVDIGNSRSLKGIVVYALTKHPLRKPLKILIPYPVIIDSIRIEETKKEGD